MARWLLDLRSVCGHPWRLGLATEPHELDAVFKLRYDVFVAEQGYNYVGTDRGPGRDADQFDAWCDQLFLFDDDRQRVVGPYRAISPVSCSRGLSRVSGLLRRVALLGLLFLRLFLLGCLLGSRR